MDNTITRKGLLAHITTLEQCIADLEAHPDSYRALVEHAPQGMVIAQKGRVVLANPAIARLTGYTLDELRGFSPEQIAQLVHEEDRSRLRRYTSHRLQGRPAPEQYEFRIIHKSGALRWLRAHATLIDHQGSPAIYINYSDITGQRHKDALPEGERKFRALFESATVGVTIVKAPNVIAEANDTLARMLGYNRDELRGMSFTDFTHPDDLPREWDLINAMLAEGRTSYTIEKRYIRRDGGVIWVRVTASLIREAGGETGFAMSVVEDITARKWAENELIKNEQKYRHLFENAQAGMARIRFPGGLILDANQRYAEIFGYKTGPDIVGHFMTEFYIDPDDRERLLERVHQQGSVRQYTVRGRRKDGEEIWLEGSGWYSAESQDILESVVIDITQRRQAENALREARDQLEAILGSVDDAVCVLDTGLHIVYANTTTARVSGYPSADALRAKPVSSITERLVLTGEDGRPISPDQLPGRLALQGIEAPPLTVGFQRIGRSTRRWGLVRATPIRDAHGAVRFTVITVTDITERKQIEQDQFDLAVERARITLLEQFIGDATHDLYTPLSAMKASLYNLEHLTDRGQRQQQIDVLKRQTAHLEQLIDDLLGMVRLENETELDRVPFDLNDLIRHVLDAHEPQIQKRGHATVFLPGTAALMIQADYNRLHRAVAALVTNAITYTPPNGIITLRTFTQAGQAVVEVSDTGMGISPQDLPHIFKRFFRADSARSSEQGGMGLGLPIAKKIIEAHQGRIDVETTPGNGSLFRVTLPLEPPLPKK